MDEYVLLFTGPCRYNVIVVEDCTVTFAEDNHIAALSLLSRCFAKVWSCEKVLNALMEATAQPQPPAKL